MKVQTSRSGLTVCVAAALMLAAVPSPLFAVDGQVAINQARALAGGVTPGDAPGFPVTITQPGSYVLSGNLTVDADTTAIVIASDHVTLDLNGFAIIGPVDCSGGLDCGAHGAVVPGLRGGGISTDVSSMVNGSPTYTPRFNITIRNGTVQGMGSFGITLAGDSHIVEYIHARSNGGDGIEIKPSEGASIVQHCTVQRNASVGIQAPNASVHHNVVDVNRYGIIVFNAGMVANNVVTRNLNDGLFLDTNVGYLGNAISGNGIGVTGGINLGQNACGSNPCPF